MRFIFILLIAIVKFGTSKTEPIGYDQKNGQINVMFPSEPNKPEDVKLSPVDSDWTDRGSKFLPNESTMRKIINIEENEDTGNEIFDIPEQHFKSLDELNDAQSLQLSNYLVKLLQRPGEWTAPVMFVREHSVDSVDEEPFPLGLDIYRGLQKRTRYYRRNPENWPEVGENDTGSMNLSNDLEAPYVVIADSPDSNVGERFFPSGADNFRGISKRFRPYLNNSWRKRQKSRNYHYDSYNPCTPTKNDVFELLKALHEQRQGNKSRRVSFCNRTRPASAVFTNIRFLGRKRK